ncbi:hypothetical protein ACTXGQ_04335 [Marinobacter sp. 1Y8]
MNSISTSQTPATPSTTGINHAFTEEQKQKTTIFFSRIRTIYGRGKTSSLWGASDDQLKVMRKEWAREIDRFTFQEIDIIFERLRGRVAKQDPDFEWPDIPKIMGLARTNCKPKAHQLLPKGLPEPEDVKRRRLERGKLAAQTARAVISGSACFIEDKPGGEHETH